MTLHEYNALRRSLRRVRVAFGCSLLALLVASMAKAGAMSLALIGMCLVSAVLGMRRLKQLASFRCPECGLDPTTRVSPDPLRVESHIDALTTHCLNCKTRLGDPDDP